MSSNLKIEFKKGQLSPDVFDSNGQKLTGICSLDLSCRLDGNIATITFLNPEIIGTVSSQTRIRGKK